MILTNVCGLQELKPESQQYKVICSPGCYKDTIFYNIIIVHTIKIL